MFVQFQYSGSSLLGHQNPQVYDVEGPITWIIPGDQYYLLCLSIIVVSIVKEVILGIRPHYLVQGGA